MSDVGTLEIVEELTTIDERPECGADACDKVAVATALYSCGTARPYCTAHTERISHLDASGALFQCHEHVGRLYKLVAWL